MSAGYRSVIAAVFGTAVALSSGAQAGVISYTGGTYGENFDSLLGSTGQSVAFTNGTTFNGFYTYISGASGKVTAGPIDQIYRSSLYNVAVSTTSTTYTSTSGVYGMYAYEPNSSTAPQLGTFNSDSNTAASTGYIATGFILKNDSSSAMNSLTLTYDMSVASGTTAVDGYAVSYAISSSAIGGVSNADATWTTVSGFGSSVSTAGVITGPTLTTLTGLTINPGDYIAVRFVDTNVSGTDRSMRYDNVQITLPEPASLSALGLVGLGLLARRRRVAR